MLASPVHAKVFGAGLGTVETAGRGSRPANDCAVPREDAVAALYRRYRAVILGRCRRLLRDAQAAEDATQETFMRVLRHATKAPAGDEALPWMLRIATNLCL